MILRGLFLALLCGSCFAQTEAPVYPLVPPGHGVNGDWAYLERYRHENAQVKPDDARVVFFGDSITENWARDPSFTENAHYLGRGISGQTTEQMLVRFRNDVINLKPKVVHIMGGTNDVAGNNGPETDEDIEGAVQSMVDLARAHHIKVVLASIPPAADFHWHPGMQPVARIRRLNAWLKSFAETQDITYVDYWSALATDAGAMKPTLSLDGVHPNSEGYKAMAPLAKAAIESALRSKPSKR